MKEKAIMKTVPNGVPEDSHQVAMIKQSFSRLSEQNGPVLPIFVDIHVDKFGEKTSVGIPNEGRPYEVNIEELQFVAVIFNGIPEIGTIVRFIIDEMLFATCGEKAEQVIAWAEKIATSVSNSLIPDFPQVCFEQVLGTVRLQGDELVTA